MGVDTGDCRELFEQATLYCHTYPVLSIVVFQSLCYQSN